RRPRVAPQPLVGALVRPVAVLPGAMRGVAHVAERVQAARGERHEGEKRPTHHRDADVPQPRGWLDQGPLRELVCQWNEWQPGIRQHLVQVGVGAIEYAAGLDLIRDAGRLVSHYQSAAGCRLDAPDLAAAVDFDASIGQLSPQALCEPSGVESVL